MVKNTPVNVPFELLIEMLEVNCIEMSGYIQKYVYAYVYMHNYAQ